MRWNEIINEGSDFNCPNCGDYLGKDTEVGNPAYCGNCGKSSTNSSGSALSKTTSSTGGRYTTTIEEDNGAVFITVKHDGKHIGTLIQYGPQFLDFDDYKWLAHPARGQDKTFDESERNAAAQYIVDEHKKLMGQN